MQIPGDPGVDPPDIPPPSPGTPAEPPQESPPGDPRPEVPVPVNDPAEPDAPREMPPDRPDELPGPGGPRTPPVNHASSPAQRNCAGAMQFTFKPINVHSFSRRDSCVESK